MTAGVQELGEEAIEFGSGELGEAVEAGAEVGETGVGGFGCGVDGDEVLSPGEGGVGFGWASENLPRTDGWLRRGLRGRDAHDLGFAELGGEEAASEEFGVGSEGDVIEEHGLTENFVEERGG